MHHQHLSILKNHDPRGGKEKTTTS